MNEDKKAKWLVGLITVAILTAFFGAIANDFGFTTVLAFPLSACFVIMGL